MSRPIENAENVVALEAEAMEAATHDDAVHDGIVHDGVPRVTRVGSNGIRIYGLPKHEDGDLKRGEKTFEKSNLMEVLYRYKRLLTRGAPDRHKPEYNRLVTKARKKFRAKCKAAGRSYTEYEIRKMVFYPEDMKLFLPIAYTTKFVEREDGGEDLTVKILFSTAYRPFEYRNGQKHWLTIDEIMILVEKYRDEIAESLRKYFHEVREKAKENGVEPEYYGYKV